MTIPSSDPDAEKIDNLRAFFEGEEPERTQSGLSVGLSDEEYKKRTAAEGEALLAEFDQLMADDEDDEINEPVLVDPDAASEAVEPTYERIDDALALTPYDKARQRLTDAEILRDVAAPGSDEYHEAMADMAAAKRDLKTAIERDADPVFRKRRDIDEHRAGPGREEYNDSRRKVRVTPNARRQDMTPEERLQHDKDMNAKRVWVSKKRKAGWSAERIEAELQGWWSRRMAKRPCA